MTAKEQALEQLITQAKTCVEVTRAQVGWDPDPDRYVPSWLPELEAAIETYEASQ